MGERPASLARAGEEDERHPDERGRQAATAESRGVQAPSLAALRPLQTGERPAALLVAAAVAGVIGVTVIVGALSIHDLSRRGGSLPGGVFIAAVLLGLAVGMYRCRYWAVLAFEALLAFQIIVTSLALVVAETLLAAGLCVLGIGAGGWLFWKLVRVMGRIQASERGGGEGWAAADPQAPRKTDQALR